MGSCTSKPGDAPKGQRKRMRLIQDGKILELQENLARTYSFPIELIVSHFTPSVFPLCPKVNSDVTKLCISTWESIENDDSGPTTGITRFYTEFYRRLLIVDTNGKFEASLTRNLVKNEDKIIAKGSILLRIIRFSFSIDDMGEDALLSLYMLGKEHAHRGIRPWQYAVFIETLLLTLSSCLGTRATNEVMKAWVNLFGFILKGMLPSAIGDSIVETELSSNTSCTFYSGDFEKEVQLLASKRGTHSVSRAEEFDRTSQASV